MEYGDNCATSFGIEFLFGSVGFACKLYQVSVSCQPSIRVSTLPIMVTLQVYSLFHRSTGSRWLKHRHDVSSGHGGWGPFMAYDNSLHDGLRNFRQVWITGSFLNNKRVCINIWPDLLWNQQRRLLVMIRARASLAISRLTCFTTISAFYRPALSIPKAKY